MMHDPRTQIVVDLASYRDMLDSDREDSSRRARWLNTAGNTALALLFVVAVMAACAALVLSPLILFAAHVRGMVTP
jgi:hypothetical protein